MARDDSPAPKHSSKADASSLRKQIDRLDQELIELLNRRAQAEVERAKTRGTSESPAAPAPGASEPWPERLAKLNGGPLPDRCLRAVYRELMSGSFALERPLRIGFLGPEGTFSHQAATSKFGSSVDYVDDMMGGGFKIENPNAVSSCGCGSSFKTEGSEAGVRGAGLGSPGTA